MNVVRSINHDLCNLILIQIGHIMIPNYAGDPSPRCVLRAFA